MLKKRQVVVRHQLQKGVVMFQGSDSREFWQLAEDGNRAAASLYNKLGPAEHEAIEAFAKWQF